MNIGEVVQKDGKLSMEIHLPFSIKERFGITANKNKTTESHPDYLVWSTFGRVGAIWNKNANGLEYKSVTIEGVFQNYSFGAFKIKEDDSRREQGVIYDVVYSRPKRERSGQDEAPQSQGSEANYGSDQEIPF